MNLWDWTFFVVGIFCLLESERFKSWQAEVFVAGLALAGAAVIAAAV